MERGGQAKGSRLAPLLHGSEAASGSGASHEPFSKYVVEATSEPSRSDASREPFPSTSLKPQRPPVGAAQAASSFAMLHRLQITAPPLAQGPSSHRHRFRRQHEGVITAGQDERLAARAAPTWE